MLNIVIPMAGRGSRFVKSGYDKPKPLIDIYGHPMIEYVTSNIRPKCDHRFIYICQKDHLDKYNLAEELNRMSEKCKIITVDHITDGAACTVLLARNYIDSDDPLMIANSDQYVDIDINDYLLAQAGWDAFIMTMKANNPKWSFIRYNYLNEVTEIREKEVISNEATVGIYNFKHGSDFVKYADRMIEKNVRVNGEFYVAPVYNEMIEDRKKIGFYNIDGMYGLGTPDDLEEFKKTKISLHAFDKIIHQNHTDCDNVEQNLKKLSNFCKGKARLFLYGAGDFGATYAGILSYLGIKSHGFIVTRNRKSERYCGLPVYEINEIFQELNERDGIILSMSSMFQSEVRACLPDCVSVYGITHGESVKLQELYTDCLLSGKLSKIFSELNVREKLLSGDHAADIFIRTLTALCNDDSEDPDFVIHSQIIKLKEDIGYGRFSCFPVTDASIVMQGPICKEYNFTLRTACFYRKLYPHIPIVISTWEGEADEIFRRTCKKFDIDVLENKLPDSPGFAHVNYQITSSRLGIEYISNHTDAKYVMKCRTDQRINKSDFLIYLKNLLKAFPAGGDKLKSRICFLEAHVGFPFFIADFLSFGTISDMTKLYYDRTETHEGDYVRNHQKGFYALANISRSVSDRFSKNKYEGFGDFLKSGRVKHDGRIYAKFCNAELFISRSFFDQYIEKISDEKLFEQYADFLKNYIIISDNLMLYWYKYQFKLRLWRDHSDNAYERWLEFYYWYQYN